MLAAAFLNPLIAWGALAAAAPIIIYLVMRQRYKVVVWGAMDFLLAAYRKTRKRRRIEELLLLAIRTLIMLLLPLGLAHPVLSASGAIAGRQEVHRVVVIDDSYSMGAKEKGATGFQRAKETAVRLIDEMERKGWATVLTANSVRRRPIAAEGNQFDTLKQEIEDLRLSHAGSDCLNCLKDVAKALKERKTIVRQEVFILTDMQGSAWETANVKDPEMVQAFDEIGKLAKQVYLVDVGSGARANLQVKELRTASRHLTPGRPVSFEAVVRNAGSGTSEPTPISLWVGLGEGAQKREEEIVAPLDAGDERTITFVTSFDDPGDKAVSVSLPGDAVPTDDARFLSASLRERIPVLLVSGEQGSSGRRADDEVFFVQAALTLTPQLSPFAVQVRGYDFDDDVDLAKNEVVVLTNLRTYTERQVQLLEQYVKSGGIVVFTAGAQVETEREYYNRLFYKDGDGLLPARLGEAVEFKEDQVRSLGLEPVPGSPLLSASVIDWKPLRGAQVLKALRLEVPEGKGASTSFQFIEVDPSGEATGLSFPALVEKPLGLGRVVLYGSTADCDWGKFPGKPHFPALWYELLFHHTRSAHKRNIRVGESFEMVFPAEALAEEVEIKRQDPDAPPAAVVRLEERENRAVLVYPEESQRSAAREGGTDASGLYEVRVGKGDGKGVHVVAVNVDPEEGKIRRLEESELLGKFPQPFPAVFCPTPESLWEKVSHRGAEQDLWRPFLWIVFAFLCLETVLAWRFGRQ